MDPLEPTHGAVTADARLVHVHPRTISASRQNVISPDPMRGRAEVAPPTGCPLLAAPPEIRLMIMSHLDDRSIANLGLACKETYEFDRARVAVALYNMQVATRRHDAYAGWIARNQDGGWTDADVLNIRTLSAWWTPSQVDHLVRATQHPDTGAIIERRARYVGAAISAQAPWVARALAHSMDQISVKTSERPGFSQEAEDRELRSEYLGWVLASIGPDAHPLVYQPFVDRMQSDRYGIAYEDTAGMLAKAIPTLPASVGDRVVDFILKHEGTIHVAAERKVEFRYVGTLKLFLVSRTLSPMNRDKVFDSAKAIRDTLSDEDDIECMALDFLEGQTFVSQEEHQRWSALFPD